MVVLWAVGKVGYWVGARAENSAVSMAGNSVVYWAEHSAVS